MRNFAAKPSYFYKTFFVYNDTWFIRLFYKVYAQDLNTLLPNFTCNLKFSSLAPLTPSQPASISHSRSPAAHSGVRFSVSQDSLLLTITCNQLLPLVLGRRGDLSRHIQHTYDNTITLKLNTGSDVVLGLLQAETRAEIEYEGVVGYLMGTELEVFISHSRQ